MKFYNLLQLSFLLSILISTNHCTGLKAKVKKAEDEDAEISDKELDEMLKKPEYAKLLNSIPSKADIEKKVGDKAGKESNSDLINLAINDPSLASLGNTGKIAGASGTGTDAKSPAEMHQQPKGKVTSYKQTQAYKDHLARIKAKNKNLEDQLKGR